MKQDCVIGRLKRSKVLKKKTSTVPLRSRDNDYSLGSLSITLYEANQPRQMAVHLEPGSGPRFLPSKIH